MSWNRWVALGAAFGFLGVLIGAFGAHGLEALLAEEAEIYEIGVRYHLVHAVGLIGMGLFMSHAPTRTLALACCFLLAGILIFSGSLYVLALSKIRWLGAVTPIGGVSFLIGWFLFGIAAWQVGDQSRQGVP